MGTVVKPIELSAREKEICHNTTHVAHFEMFGAQGLLRFAWNLELIGCLLRTK
jgi:hypothetical protein